MSSKKITLLGSQSLAKFNGNTLVERSIEDNIHGNLTLPLPVGSSTEGPIAVFETWMGARRAGNAFVRLYDKNNTLVKEKKMRLNTGAVQVVLQLRASNVSEESFVFFSETGINHYVAPDQFATGRVEIEFFGSLPGGHLETRINTPKLNGVIIQHSTIDDFDGDGHYSLSMPFTVEFTGVA